MEDASGEGEKECLEKEDALNRARWRLGGGEIAIIEWGKSGHPPFTGISPDQNWMMMMRNKKGNKILVKLNFRSIVVQHQMEVQRLYSPVKTSYGGMAWRENLLKYWGWRWRQIYPVVLRKTAVSKQLVNQFLQFVSFVLTASSAAQV